MGLCLRCIALDKVVRVRALRVRDALRDQKRDEQGDEVDGNKDKGHCEEVRAHGGELDREAREERRKLGHGAAGRGRRLERARLCCPRCVDVDLRAVGRVGRCKGAEEPHEADEGEQHHVNGEHKALRRCASAADTRNDAARQTDVDFEQRARRGGEDEESRGQHEHVVEREQPRERHHQHVVGVRDRGAEEQEPAIIATRRVAGSIDEREGERDDEEKTQDCKHNAKDDLEGAEAHKGPAPTRGLLALHTGLTALELPARARECFACLSFFLRDAAPTLCLCVDLPLAVFGREQRLGDTLVLTVEPCHHRRGLDHGDGHGGKARGGV
eukprot:Amastigsp_a175226_187.p2 type:complete len:328 gc:universal Amastigsp_a175226_187:1-984(+)